MVWVWCGVSHISHCTYSAQQVVRGKVVETLFGLLRSDRSGHSSVRLSSSSLPAALQNVPAPRVSCLHWGGGKGKEEMGRGEEEEEEGGGGGRRRRRRREEEGGGGGGGGRRRRRRRREEEEEEEEEERQTLLVEWHS